jgi:hypothetical protein
MDRTDNSYEMNQAIDRLDAEYFPYEQTTQYQLKVGAYSFYPSSGTIYMDGASRREAEGGLEAFLALIRKLKKRNPSAFQKRAARRGKGTDPFDLRD